MTTIALDSLHRTRLGWPEPLVLDLIAEIYREMSADDEVWAAARLHARFLRDLIEGDTRAAGTARLELIASCAARAIDPVAIERAEQAVFREMLDLARTRFRNSPRLRGDVVAKLTTAQAALTKRAEAPSKPIKSPQRRTRPPLDLRPSLAAVG